MLLLKFINFHVAGGPEPSCELQAHKVQLLRLVPVVSSIVRVDV